MGSKVKKSCILRDGSRELPPSKHNNSDSLIAIVIMYKSRYSRRVKAEPSPTGPQTNIQTFLLERRRLLGSLWCGGPAGGDVTTRVARWCGVCDRAARARPRTTIDCTAVRTAREHTTNAHPPGSADTTVTAATFAAAPRNRLPPPPYATRAAAGERAKPQGSPGASAGAPTATTRHQRPVPPTLS